MGTVPNLSRLPPRVGAHRDCRSASSLSSALFDCHALGEVAWLVDVQPAQYRAVIRK
jgi:hypothetical protein